MSTRYRSSSRTRAATPRRGRAATPRRSSAPQSFTIEVIPSEYEYVKSKRSSSAPNGNSRGSGNRASSATGRESSEKEYTPVQMFHHEVSNIYKKVAKDAKDTTKKAWGERHDMSPEEKAEVLEEHAEKTRMAAAKIRELGEKLDAEMAAKAAEKKEKKERQEKQEKEEK